MKRLVAGGLSLEYAWHCAEPETSPTLVFLHEGLGSAKMWRDFPEAIARRTGWGALVYSRAGYGGSEAARLPRPLDYMQIEGERVVGEVLDRAGVRDAILVGHSDGASIAIVHAGSRGSARRGGRVRGLVLIAPHVFTEEKAVVAITAAKRAYDEGDLRARLAKWHDHVDVAFRGWNDAWLDPGFRAWNIESYLRAIGAPTLVIQGEDDEYGTLAQVDTVVRGAAGRAEALVLAECGHSPQKDRRAETEDAIVAFVHAQASTLSALPDASPGAG